MVLSVTAVRVAEPDDLDYVQQIEDDAGMSFAHLGNITGWPASLTGQERASTGTVLVVGQPPVGFAHVVELASGHHLQELAVVPKAQRMGLGWSLLRSAFGVVADAGGDRLTLTTFADVPWNGPWYERVGFVPMPEPLPPELEQLREREREVGLDSGGRRIAMWRPIVDEPEPSPAVSVLPLREGENGLEVFVQHRVGTMAFVPNAVVFPGGRTDPEDEATGAHLDLDPGLCARHVAAWSATNAARLGGGERAARTLLATGMREVREETGARIDPAEMLPWDNWITPIGGPRRYDVRFYLLPVRDEVTAAEFVHATTEAHRSEWMPVAELAARAEDRSLLLVAPTRVLVEELTTLATVAEAEALRPEITPMRHDMAPTPSRRPGRARDRIVP